LRDPRKNPVSVLENFIMGEGLKFHPSVIDALAISIKYEGHIQKHNEDYKKVEKIDSCQIQWQKLANSQQVSFECRKRIEESKPHNFLQLKKINGIRPATLSYALSLFQ
jgi:tRNA uridine 5-carboxymethylaminomethyl modification enzyme